MVQQVKRRVFFTTHRGKLDRYRDDRSIDEYKKYGIPKGTVAEKFKLSYYEEAKRRDIMLGKILLDLKAGERKKLHEKLQKEEAKTDKLLEKIGYKLYKAKSSKDFIDVIVPTGKEFGLTNFIFDRRTGKIIGETVANMNRNKLTDPRVLRYKKYDPGHITKEQYDFIKNDAKYITKEMLKNTENNYLDIFNYEHLFTDEEVNNGKMCWKEVAERLKTKKN